MYEISFQEYWPAINEALTIALGGAVICLLGWSTWFLHKHAPAWLSDDAQAKIAKVIDTGLQRAVSFALNTVEAHEKDVKITTDSKIVQIGANYAIKHMGVVLGKAGKTPVDVAEMIVARLPVAPTEKDITGNKIPVVTTVEIKELPPVP